MTATRAMKGLPDWIRHNLVGLIVTGIVSGAVGYAVNVWLMAVRYEGSVTPEGAPAVSKDNLVAGGIFWAMFPMVACTAIGYRRAVGAERFWRDVRRLPMTLVGLFRRDGSQGWVHLLWGAAIALAATLLVPPAVGAVLGVGLLIGAPSIVGSVLSSVFAQLWRLVGKVVAPTKDHRVAPVLKVAVGILGWAVALVLGFVLPGEWIRLVLALGCAAGAFLLGRRTATTVLLIVGYVVVDLLTAAPALADDGGFAECGSTLEGWIRSCSGAGEIRRRALIGAILAAQFGALGFISGGFVGLHALPSGGGSWWDRLGLDELPRGPIDPETGEALVVNDGRWPEVPVGHVFYEGAWAHPEAVGALPGVDDEGQSVDLEAEGALPGVDDEGESADLEAVGALPGVDDEPFTADPIGGVDDDAAHRPALWLPPLVAAAIAATTSAPRTSATQRAQAAAARRGRARLAEAEAIRTEMAVVGVTDDDRVRLQAAFRAKAIEIAADPEARLAVAADTTGVGQAITDELDAVDTEVLGVFVERLNELGMSRDGRPVTTEDVSELRERSFSPGGLGKLWKGYGAKRGKFAIDAATYLLYLEGRRDDPTTAAEDRPAIERKIERLRAHMEEDGVTTVMVSEAIWNDVAQFAYALASGETSG